MIQTQEQLRKSLIQGSRQARESLMDLFTTMMERYLQLQDEIARSTYSREMGEVRDDLKLRFDLVGKTQYEQESIRLVADMRRRASELGISDPAAIDREVAASKALLEMTQHARELEEIATGVGRSFEDAFTGIITGADSVREALQQLFFEIQQMIVRQAVAKPLGEIITRGLFTGLSGAFGASGDAALAAKHDSMSLVASAQGNVFGYNGLEAFASGGVVTRSTLFGMKGGRTGLMGEAGPEAIMPLTRTPDGKLGVASSGSGPQVINQTFNIKTPDAESFRRSRRQMGGLMKGLME